MTDDLLTEEKAIEWIRNNKRVIIEKFASLQNFPGVTNPFTMFMAGSPGAGKTEFSKSFIETYPDHDTKIVRIDADEIREQIPGYNGYNAYIVQSAAFIGVEKLFDYIQDHRQNAIVDGTFAVYEISRKNIVRSLDKDRKVGIMYLYQDPVIAWHFTKIREKEEKRHISKEMFIRSFLAARINVDKIKEEFGNKVELNIAIKNYENRLEKTQFKIDKVDKYIKKEYTKEDLEKLLT